MARTNSTKSNKVDPTRAFYAAVGGVDIAVAYARTGLAEAQTRLAQVDFEPKALANQGATLVSSRVDDLNQQYVELAARGRTLVGRIRGQAATQELKSQAGNTASGAKATATQTKNTVNQAAEAAEAMSNAAKTAKSSAKGTGTSAKKTAEAAKQTTQDAAAKTGA